MNVNGFYLLIYSISLYTLTPQAASLLLPTYSVIKINFTVYAHI